MASELEYADLRDVHLTVKEGAQGGEVAQLPPNLHQIQYLENEEGYSFHAERSYLESLVTDPDVLRRDAEASLDMFRSPHPTPVTPPPHSTSEQPTRGLLIDL